MWVTVEAELPIPAHQYMLERDGAAFRSFIAEEMNLMEYEITECWKEGSATKIKIHSKPDVGAWIPSALSSKIPDSLAYDDEVTYRPEELQQPPYILHINSVCPALGDKGRFKSKIMILPVGQDRCRHVLEQSIEFKGMFGFGGVAKKLAKKSIEQTFADMPGIIEKWLGVRQELLQTPHGRERLVAGRPCVEGVEWLERAVAEIKQGKPGQGKPGHPRHHRHSHHKQGKPAEAGGPAMAAAGAQASLPLPTPFAAASGADGLPKQTHPQPQPGPAGQAVPQAGPVGQAVLEAVPAEDGAAFHDTMAARPGRQSTTGTVFYTPSASPAASASTELPVAGVGQAPQAQPQQGQLLDVPGGEAGPEAAGREGSHSSGYSGSEESAQEEDVEEQWGKVGPWRAYYMERGLTPTRASRVLPDQLVQRFLPRQRPQPVQVEKLPGGTAGVEAGGKHSRMQRIFGACAGRHSSGDE